MTKNLDYLEELVVLGSVIILRGGGGNGECLVSGGSERGSVVANRVKNGDYEEYTANELYF